MGAESEEGEEEDEKLSLSSMMPGTIYVYAHPYIILSTTVLSDKYIQPLMCIN